MILDIICVRNKRMGCYANPTFTQEKLENLQTSITRALVSSNKVREQYVHCAIYHFGTFDDVLGKYDLKPEPEFLFDCDDILAQLPKED